MIIVHLFSPTYWSIWFEGSYYNDSPKKLAKAKDWCLTAKADMCYNLAYFQMSSGKTVNFVQAQGYDVGYGGVQDRISVSAGNVCGGYAVGVKDNEVVIKAESSARTRNGIGLTKSGHIIIAQSTSKVTERNFCKEVTIQVNQYYKDSVKLFLMEDGGGSTQMYSGISKLGISPEGGRRVATVTCVKRRIPLKATRTLKTGCAGEDVRQLQIVLGGLVCDGSFGNATKKRLKACQKELGLTPDGCAGPITLKALGMG